VAHNGLAFDRQVLKAWAEKYGLDWQPDKLWIDTKTDIEIPSRNSTRLVYLAADHGFLNPFPHRAMFDVMTMMTILSRYDLDKVIEVAKSPTLTLRAMVSYDDRELAKARGYHWQSETKQWTMNVKECNLEKERAASKFQIEIIK
jgi:DNA polymerase-3 subunit epsilon